MKGHIEERKLALLAGGDLDPKKSSGVTRHLADCSACSARLKRYQEGREAMSVLRDSGIEARDFAAVRQSVLARIQGKQVSRREPSAWRRFGWLQWAARAAAVLFAAAIGTWLWRSAPAPPAPGPAASASMAQVGQTQAPGKTPAKPAAKQSLALNVERRTQASSRSVTSGRSLPGARVGDSLEAPEAALPAPDDVIIRMETSDPNVIIVWLASQKGAAR
jgi:hypothetical protein